MRFLKIVLHCIWVIVLTAMTQIGGLIWILTLILSVSFKKKKRFVFPVLYLIFNLLIIPPTAKLFGRERLPIFSKTIKPRNLIYPLLFRNYVTPNLGYLLVNASIKLKKNNIQITYLDANFPFFEGFPLLPHLSHNDGKKIDVSFMYVSKTGKTTNKKPTVSGYGCYVNNSPTSLTCKDKGYWQYDFASHLSFGTINTLKFDAQQTSILIKVLLSHPNTQKIFIEPYLKQQLGFQNYSKIRFHGCQAVRHDDHIHLQIK